MTDSVSHPGRALEFLSRLHDGELSAAERAAFESHRAHCAECRRAAAEFEAALALYRSSRPQPPPADLSARILRKLQASNRRRSPFGVTFGIDVRWAGAFLAALLAVIIGSTVVVRREAYERKIEAERAPIPVVMERRDLPAVPSGDQAPAKPLEKDQARPAPPSSGATGGENRRSGIALSTPLPASTLKESAAKPKLSAGPINQEAAARGDSDARSTPDRAPEASAASAAPRPNEAAAPARNGERLGGESGTVSSFASDSLAARVRLEILAVDQGGEAPKLASGEDIDLPVELRGHEFVLIVEASGRVRDVKTADQTLQKRQREEAAEGSAPADKKTLRENQLAQAQQSLKQLRFRPADRPRILRVRVQ